MDVDAYRRSAEEFVSTLEAEYYRHFAGLKDAYEIEPIYARHASLFTRERVEAIRELCAGAPQGSERQRRLRMLLDLAVDGHVGEASKALEEELAGREAALTIELDGERIGFRAAAVLQANEPDPRRRGLIETARVELVERELGALYRELHERRHACARSLGWGSYLEMCEECKAVDFSSLATETGEFSAASARDYPRLLEPELRRTLGVGLGQLRRADLPRFFRAHHHDRWFPADRLVPAFVETMRGLGIDVAGQAGVVLDLERRPNKSPRAFCAPVRTPSEVYLVLAPTGGREDFWVLFHEAGHTEHYAHVDPSLPFEFRYLGDNAITECYAFLFQHLVEEPQWLARHLEVGEAGELIEHGRAQRLVYLRRYAAKLAYELELHGAANLSLASLPDRYAELLGAALMIPWPRQMFLADVDPGFYSACYLRAWALETHLRSWLRDRFGPRWFDSSEAGAALRRLWRQGQRLTPEELLGDLTGERLDFRVLLSDLGIGNVDLGGEAGA